MLLGVYCFEKNAFQKCLTNGCCYCPNFFKCSCYTKIHLSTFFLNICVNLCIQMDIYTHNLWRPREVNAQTLSFPHYASAHPWYISKPYMPRVCYYLEPGITRVCNYLEPGIPRVCYYLPRVSWKTDRPSKSVHTKSLTVLLPCKQICKRGAK